MIRNSENQTCLIFIESMDIYGYLWISMVIFDPFWLEAWMKLRSLAEGAQLATRHFLQQSAPVPCRSVCLAGTPFRAVIFSEEWNMGTIWKLYGNWEISLIDTLW